MPVETVPDSAPVTKSQLDIETEKTLERWKRSKILFNTQCLGHTLIAFQKQALAHGYVIREDKHVSMKLMSRDSGKSWLETINGSVFDICNDPETAIQIIAESQTTGKLFLGQIKQTLERSENIKKYYGIHRPTDRLTPWSKTEIVSALRTQIRKEPTVEVFGVNGAIVGRHVPRQKIDDISTLKTARTPQKRQQIIEWYHNVAKYCLEKGGFLDIAGTRYYPGDFYEYLIDLWGEDILFRVPALQTVEPEVLEKIDGTFEVKWDNIISNGDACDARTNESIVEKSTYPDRFDVGTLFEERASNPVAFSYQRQNDVSLAQSQFIEADKVLVQKEEELPKFGDMLYYIAADPATGTKRNHDQFSCTIGGFHPNTGLIYTIHNDANRFGDTMSMLHHIKTLYNYVISRGGSVACCAIESNAFQKVLAETMRKMSEEFGMIPVQEIQTLTDKEQRFVSKVWMINSQRVRFTNNCGRLVTDLLRFPNVDNDDRVDSFMLMLESLTASQVMTKAFRVNIRDLDETTATFIGF